MTIDGFRLLDPASRQTMRAWLRTEPTPDGIPWTPLAKPLSAMRVALVSSAGLARLDDVPFDQEGERRNPWWGDPSYRVLPREVAGDQVGVYHLHIAPRPAATDLDCLFPLRRLDQLVERGVVGSSAAQHYSIMGYLLRTERLLAETAPRIAEALVRDQVDLALLVPV